MIWRDFFYFSKGERRGLILLLSLIVIAGTILFFNKQPAEIQKEKDTVSKTGTVSKDSVLVADEVSNPGQPSADYSRNTSSGASTRASSSGASTRPSSNTSSSSANRRESVSERVSRLTSRPQPTFTRAEKFEEGTIVELNTADTTILKKVPGIGSAFASRIVNYRKILGGYHSVAQLSEVYGIDDERFVALQPWFSADPSYVVKIEINKIPQDSLQRHPYINYGQARVIVQQRRQKGKLTGWENLQLLNEFTENDINKLKPYISFE